MATYYWVGGTDYWDNVNSSKWSLSPTGGGGAGIPTYQDDVVFTVNSGPANFRCNVLSTVSCANLTISQGFVGILGGQASAIIKIYGETITLANTGIFDPTNSPTLEIRSGPTKVTKITTAGQTVGNIQIYAASTLQLNDNLNAHNNQYLKLYDGTFDANNKNVTIGNFLAGPGVNGNNRALIMGTGTWSLLNGGPWGGTPRAVETIWDIQDPDITTVLADSCTLRFIKADDSAALDESMTTSSTTIILVDATIASGTGANWDTYGTILIDDELITYTTLTGSLYGNRITLGNLTRGYRNTTISTHSRGSSVIKIGTPAITSLASDVNSTTATPSLWSTDTKLAEYFPTNGGWVLVDSEMMYYGSINDPNALGNLKIPPTYITPGAALLVTSRTGLNGKLNNHKIGATVQLAQCRNINFGGKRYNNIQFISTGQFMQSNVSNSFTATTVTTRSLDSRGIDYLKFNSTDQSTISNFNIKGTTNNPIYISGANWPIDASATNVKYNVKYIIDQPVISTTATLNYTAVPAGTVYSTSTLTQGIPAFNGKFILQANVNNIINYVNATAFTASSTNVFSMIINARDIGKTTVNTAIQDLVSATTEVYNLLPSYNFISSISGVIKTSTIISIDIGSWIYAGTSASRHGKVSSIATNSIGGIDITLTNWNGTNILAAGIMKVESPNIDNYGYLVLSTKNPVQNTYYKITGKVVPTLHAFNSNNPTTFVIPIKYSHGTYYSGSFETTIVPSPSGLSGYDGIYTLNYQRYLESNPLNTKEIGICIFYEKINVLTGQITSKIGPISYLMSQDIYESDTTSGRIKFNNSNVYASTQIYADIIDYNENNALNKILGFHEDLLSSTVVQCTYTPGASQGVSFSSPITIRQGTRIFRVDTLEFIGTVSNDSNAPRLSVAIVGGVSSAVAAGTNVNCYCYGLGATGPIPSTSQIFGKLYIKNASNDVTYSTFNVEYPVFALQGSSGYLKIKVTPTTTALTSKEPGLFPYSDTQKSDMMSLYF